jgi:hypothetical protein
MSHSTSMGRWWTRRGGHRQLHEIAEQNGYGKLTADNVARMRELSIMERCKAWESPRTSCQG